jgi:type IV pilus assembly protein PilA
MTTIKKIRTTKQKGFSLIELLIVVAIILIIAGIAIPNLLRSRMAPNEASAVGSIPTIDTSAVTYSFTYPAASFPATLATLGGATPCTATSTNACVVDAVLAGGTKSGYKFAWTTDSNTPSVGYSITGTGVIRYSATGAGATSASPALQYSLAVTWQRFGKKSVEHANAVARFVLFCIGLGEFLSPAWAGLVALK